MDAQQLASEFLALGKDRETVVGYGRLNSNGTITVSGQGRSVSAIPQTEFRTGVWKAIKVNNTWYAYGEPQGVLSSRSILERRARPQEKTETGSIKVLFSVEDGTHIKYFVGGDRANPTEIAKLPISEYPLAAGIITNLGASKNQWRVDIATAGDKFYEQPTGSGGTFLARSPRLYGITSGSTLTKELGDLVQDIGFGVGIKNLGAGFFTFFSQATSVGLDSYWLGYWLNDKISTQLLTSTSGSFVDYFLPDKTYDTRSGIQFGNTLESIMVNSRVDKTLVWENAGNLTKIFLRIFNGTLSARLEGVPPELSPTLINTDANAFTWSIPKRFVTNWVKDTFYCIGIPPQLSQLSPWFNFPSTFNTKTTLTIKSYKIQNGAFVAQKDKEVALMPLSSSPVRVHSFSYHP